MADGRIKQINELAHIVYIKEQEKSKASDSNAAKSKIILEYTPLNALLMNYSKNYAKKSDGVNDVILSDAFQDAFWKSLEEYDGVRDFLPLFVSVFHMNLRESRGIKIRPAVKKNPIIVFSTAI